MSRNRWYNDRINEPWHNQIGGGFAVPNQNFQQNQGQANQGKTGGTGTVMVNSNTNPNNLVAGLAASTPAIPAVPEVPYQAAVYSAEIPYQPAVPEVPYQPAVPEVPYQPAIPYQPAVPEVPYQAAVPEVPYQPAVPEVPYQAPVAEVPYQAPYNPNTNAQNLTVGVTNQGTAPNVGCPCSYEMNCWSDTCPSSLTTYSNLPSATCPPNTQDTEPDCTVPEVPYQPAIPEVPYQAAIPEVQYQPAIPEVPYQPAIPEVQAQAEIQYQPAIPEVPYQAAIPEVPYQAPQLITPEVPYQPAQAAVPATYTMNCWPQQCPSTLTTYTGLNSPTCPAYTQEQESPCMVAVPANQNMSAFSGFSGDDISDFRNSNDDWF